MIIIAMNLIETVFLPCCTLEGSFYPRVEGRGGGGGILR